MLRLGFVLLFCTGSLFSLLGKNRAWVTRLDSMSVNQIDRLKLTGLSIEEYTQITTYAVQLMRDTSSSNRNFKGNVLMTVTANHLGDDIKNGRLNPKKSGVKSLLQTFESFQYYIYQPKIPDFLKLAHYLCQGKYHYVYTRARVTWYFFPGVFLSGLIAVAFTGNLLGFFNWKHRKTMNKLLVFLIVALIILAFAFQLTCEECVKKDSFYGIPF